MKDTNKSRWDNEEKLRLAIKSSKTKADVLKIMGVNYRKAGNYDSLNRAIKRFSINTDHLLGRAGGGFKQKIPLKKILIKNSLYPRSHLKTRLLKNNLLKTDCYICGQNALWRGKPLVMILDHINGVNDDNRLKNLRMLCPNCNSQQKTFCRRS